MEKTADLYTRVTNKIIADLEQGALTWQKPWRTDHLAACITKPLRHNGIAYQGINIILLWAACADKGYVSNLWMTYKQALELGAQVRKGSKGEAITYANKLTKQEELCTKEGVLKTLDREIYFMKTIPYSTLNRLRGCLTITTLSLNP